jgi:pseudouridine-5'-phosphate glycosidase/pseudouridine kinase
VHDGKYLVLTHYPALKIDEKEIISTTGAGDTLVGGLVAGLVDGGKDEAGWVGRALERVGKTIRSNRAVG